tara:strand:- start:6121 stop:6342 length:222 start_codon:yes stop_codon:yes gene_type:complete
MKATFDKSDVIHLNTKFDGKSRREGTKVAKIFACYKNGMTVEEFLEASKEVGGHMGNLHKDVNVGRVIVKKAA